MGRIHKKHAVDRDVYELSLDRVRLCFDRFDKVVVSFSGGKDSTACLQLALTVARERGRLPLDVYTFDEEAIPPETVEYLARVAALPDIRFLWFCLPVEHRNACSPSDPVWYPWDPAARERWCRPLPRLAITTLAGHVRHPIPESTPRVWPASFGNVANIMGIRCVESISRYRAIATKLGPEAFLSPFAEPGAKHITNAYPIYDWPTEDVWLAPSRFGWDYNRAYDTMRRAGISIALQRCAPPFGEQPIRGLWTFKVCWPELWGKMIDRVAGAATAARYANTELYLPSVQGQGDGIPAGAGTWRDAVLQGLDALPPANRAEVARAVASAMSVHRGRSCEVLPDTEPDPLSGVCWREIFPVVKVGSNKFNRQGQRIEAKFLANRRKNGILE